MNAIFPKILMCSILLQIAFSSCSKKAQPTSITGRVYTRNTDIGHEGLRIWLEVNDGDAGAHGGGGSGGYNGLVSETTTDEFGYYSLNHKCYPDRRYYLHLEGKIPKHWSGNWSARQVWPGNSQDLSYKVSPYGYLNIRFKSVHPPISIEDVVAYNFMTIAQPDNGHYLGGAFDFMKTFRVLGNHENIVQLSYEKDNVWTDTYDTIYVSTEDTAYYEFLY